MPKVQVLGEKMVEQLSALIPCFRTVWKAAIGWLLLPGTKWYPDEAIATLSTAESVGQETADGPAISNVVLLSRGCAMEVFVSQHWSAGAGLGAI